MSHLAPHDHGRGHLLKSASWAVVARVFFELDADGVVAALVDVLDGMRTLRFHPAHAPTGRGPGA